MHWRAVDKGRGRSWGEFLKSVRLDIAPVVTVLPSDTVGRTTKTPAGRTITICPATYREDVSCASCQLCQRQKNRAIVGFPAHGSAHKRASAIAAQ